MGYYTGNGKTISKRANALCHAVEVIPTWILDGKPMGWTRVVHTGTTTETVTIKRGVSEPASVSASITMSNTNPPHEASYFAQEANRIGDSNLWEVKEISRTTTG